MLRPWVASDGGILLRRFVHALGAMAAAAALCALASCSDAVTGSRPHPRSAAIALSARVDMAGSANLVVEVAAADLPAPLVFNAPVRDGLARAVLEIPAGTARQLTATLFGQDGTVTHRGQVVMDVAAGSNPPVALTLLPLAANDPIVVTLADVSVQVVPHRVSAAVGDTVRLKAVVLSARGDTLAAQVLWYSFDTRKAVVDASGLVSARDTGSVQIVAGTSGVADVAELSVAPRAPHPNGLALPRQRPAPARLAH